MPQSAHKMKKNSIGEEVQLEKPAIITVFLVPYFL
jgi:hypothetical protein